MYQEHFGLSRPPFKITPDTSLFFEGNQRGAALDALMYAITSGEGIIKVVGEVGSGKTMLCRMLEVRLSNDVDVIYIANPSLSPDNILHVIAHELHLDVNNEMSKVDVMQRIQTHLLKKHADNRQVVLFVEEAQSMPIETLEEIRLLSNLETDHNKLLQMVLFGQPELDEKLSQPHIRQLKERITHSFYLAPFPPDDTLHYLNFRLRAVGYKGPDIFNKKTAGVVKKYSAGLTRRINILADKSMLAAFSEGSHTVTATHVKSAAEDSEFKNSINSKKILISALALVLLAVVLFAGIYIGRQEWSQRDLEKAQDAPVVEQKKIPSLSLAPQAGPQPAAEEVSSIPAGKIRERLAETRQWFSTAADNNFSIQLFMARTSDADKVEAFLLDAPETLDLTKIYIYETVINGRSWYSVLYNEFITQDDAIEKLDTLPASLKASDPYLRRVSALKKDVAR
ncbi:MAG: AAA family ATPase [Gammaproteobacteria bacterium]|nr:AAA family ATPase [Gammaproteobacteria bacterium]MBT8133279.1 AAA family ATPase [Gammaproteobacteria bacterium]NNJ49375.1 AAA family ATPase [Gammaproteobacteria bacterium]